MDALTVTLQFKSGNVVAMSVLLPVIRAYDEGIQIEFNSALNIVSTKGIKGITLSFCGFGVTLAYLEAASARDND